MKKTNEPKSRHQRFIEAAREAEYSEDEAEFDENLKRIATEKPTPGTKPQK